MSLRLLEILLPSGNSADTVKELLGDIPYIDLWDEEISEKSTIVKIIAHAEGCEDILDTLEKRYSGVKGYRLVLLPLEAVLPRPEEPKKEPEEAPESEKEKSILKIGRISREELYADISESADVTIVYLVLVVLSSVVGSIGILNNNVAIIIGAMVIAPLIGPSIALAFGTTLGDTDLIKKALWANFTGVAAALAFAIAIGALFTVDPSIRELASRTNVGFGDIALALAAGVAGTLSFTKGLPGALIGVMVAVALLPPTVSLGILIGSGNITPALGALQLLLVNLICINLAGVTTFFVQGVRPLTWWEAERAERATRTAIIIWSVLLVLLVVIIFFFKRYVSG
jgi:uncharacterized hydrophobic protein (TIGR00341 family)